MVFPGKKRDWCPGADSAVINPVINPINPRVGHGGGDVIASELSILPRSRSRSDFMDLGKFSSSSKAEGICTAGAESQRESPGPGDTKRGPAPAAHSPAANPGIRGWEGAGSRGRVRGFTGEGAAAGDQLDPPRSSGSPRDSSSLHPAPKTSKTPSSCFFFFGFLGSPSFGGNFGGFIHDSPSSSGSGVPRSLQGMLPDVFIDPRSSWTGNGECWIPMGKRFTPAAPGFPWNSLGSR